MAALKTYLNVIINYKWAAVPLSQSKDSSAYNLGVYAKKKKLAEITKQILFTPMFKHRWGFLLWFGFVCFFLALSCISSLGTIHIIVFLNCYMTPANIKKHVEEELAVF